MCRGNWLSLYGILSVFIQAILFSTDAMSGTISDVGDLKIKPNLWYQVPR
jgi:hypothetical protein